jgi:hypothetical protein
LTEKKFRRVVLHFGADKTGSTAIQKAFDLTRQPLLASGVLAYPPGEWHAQLGSYFCDKPLDYIFNIQVGTSDSDQIRDSDRLYFEKLERWLNQIPACESVLFSYEGFVSLDAIALGKFKAFCEQLADIVGVLLYVRPPLSYAISAMSQRVKQGIPAWPHDDPPIASYKTVLDRMTAVFGKPNICVRSFTPDALKNADVLQDFCSTLGIPAKLTEKILSNALVANESLSQAGLRFGEVLKNALSDKGLDFSEGEFYDKFGQHLASIPGNKIQLTSDQIEDLLSITNPHSSYLKQQYDIAFNEDVKKYLNSAKNEPENQENLMRAFGKILTYTVGYYRQQRAESFEPEFLLLSVKPDTPKNVQRGQTISVSLEFSLDINVSELEITANVIDKSARWIAGANITLLDRPLTAVARGCHKIQYDMPADFPVGQYSLGFTFAECRAGGTRNLARFGKLVEFEITTQATDTPPSTSYTLFEHQHTSDISINAVEDANGSICCSEALGDISVGEHFELPVQLQNNSAQTWASIWNHPINFSYRWLDNAGNVVVPEGERTPVPLHRVMPGQTVTSLMSVLAPDVPGLYKLQLVPVQEKWCWFDEKGFTPTKLELTVVMPGNLQRYPAADIRFTSKTGQREGSELVSTGRAGLLLYGPYAPLPAGRYVARFYGHCDADAKGGWVDACFDKGGTVLTRVELGDSFIPGVIAELPFEIAQPVKDLEVRLWMPAKATVRVKSLCIEPYTAAKPAAKKPPSAEPMPPKAEPSKPKKIKK